MPPSARLPVSTRSRSLRANERVPITSTAKRDLQVALGDGIAVHVVAASVSRSLCAWSEESDKISMRSISFPARARQVDGGVTWTITLRSRASTEDRRSWPEYDR